jgi:hypothetical protein
MGKGQYLYLGPNNHLNLSSELGMRATDNSRDHKAYEAGMLPPIANFKTYESDVIGQVAGSSSTGVTVNGANQGVTPVAYQSDGTLAAGEVDNPSQQTLTVSASSGLVAGDAITLAGVNRVAHLSKKDTGNLATFRVLAVNGNDLTISPAIVATGAYQNVTAEPANGAAVTVINTDDAEPAVFTADGAGTFLVSDINWKQIEGSDRVIESYTTKYGLSFYFIRIGNGITGQVNYRLCAWGKYNLVKPEYAGIILPNQNAAI